MKATPYTYVTMFGSPNLRFHIRLNAIKMNVIHKDVVYYFFIQHRNVMFKDKEKIILFI